METIYKTEYNGMLIEVVETQQTVYLQFDGGLNQSSFKKKNPKELHKKYAKHMVDVLNHTEPPHNILVLGLGGGVIPKWLHENTEAVIDVVEIVPEMKEIAENYFGLPKTDRMNIIVADVRDYISTCTKKYDLVFVDVFGATGNGIENEFHSDIKGVLKNTGFVSLNSLVTQRNYNSHMEDLNSIYSEVIEAHVKLGRYSNNHIAYCKS